MSRLGGFLTGIKILDLSRHLPGPLATLILADLGAEVLKIEPPAGDEMRLIGGTADAPSPYFRVVNAGKSTCRLDLKSHDGRAALEGLIADADVLVESFRPGIMARLGLPPERLKALNPRLVTCALSGFGQTGPLSDRAGHDLNYLALTGLLAAMAAPGAALAGGTPAVRYPPMADVSASFMAAIAILGALQGRARTGQGATIDLALADAAFPQFVFSLADLGMVQGGGGANGLLGGGAAFYDSYAVRDGAVTLAAIEPKFWRAFCAAAERPDWLPRQGEAFPQDALRVEIAALFAGLTLAEAIARFEPADCCFAPVLDLPAALAAGHVAERGLVRTGPDGLTQALFPALVDGEAPPVRAPLRDFGDGLALAARAER